MTPIYCSFCGHEHRANDPIVMIAGPTVFICETCVAQAAAKVAETKEARTLARDGWTPTDADGWSMKPEPQ